jgi:hypothetical protein
MDSCRFGAFWIRCPKVAESGSKSRLIKQSTWLLCGLALQPANDSDHTRASISRRPGQRLDQRHHYKNSARERVRGEAFHLIPTCVHDRSRQLDRV